MPATANAKGGACSTFVYGMLYGGKANAIFTGKANRALIIMNPQRPHSGDYPAVSRPTDPLTFSTVLIRTRRSGDRRVRAAGRARGIES